MDTFIQQFNHIIETVDPDTLDLIVFPQLSRELDQLDAKP